MRKWLGLSLSLLLLGCANMAPHEYIVDTQYVAKVNQGAKLGGGQVIWLQYPTIRTTTAAAAMTPQS